MRGLDVSEDTVSERHAYTRIVRWDEFGADVAETSSRGFAKQSSSTEYKFSRCYAKDSSLTTLTIRIQACRRNQARLQLRGSASSLNALKEEC